ncbi:MAG: hypothetical protein WBW81_07310, partial [Methylocella sp.]
IFSYYMVLYRRCHQKSDNRSGFKNMADKPLKKESLPEAEIAERMDCAIRRSLQMPPKLHKDSRKPRRRKAKAAAAKPETETS